MEYTNKNCICFYRQPRLGGGEYRAYHCPIDGAFFWTVGDVESGYENVFGESAEEVAAEMRRFSARKNIERAYITYYYD